jgi:hypothetical protein
MGGGEYNYGKFLYKGFEMKKFILVFSLLFGSSLLSANSLAVSDQQFLFGKTQNVEAQLVSNNEMGETEGKWGWAGFAKGIASYTFKQVLSGKEFNFKDAMVSGVIGAANPFTDAGPLAETW